MGSNIAPDILGLIPGTTRTGQRQELLRGPFIYGLVHSALAALFWRQPAALVAVGALCGGDGFAEVVGTSVQSPPLPWNKNKSVAGSIACAAASTLFGLALLSSSLSIPLTTAVVKKVAMCSLVGAAVESLPLTSGSIVEGLDNLTVPLAVLLIGTPLFG